MVMTPANVIDVSAWVGNYPFRGIPNSGVDDLKRKLDELHISRAIVAPFEAIFWENNLDAYERWTDLIAAHRELELWPVMRPGATLGLDKLLDRFKPRGIRLLPNYHGYRLSDRSVEPILKMARERDLIVQVFARIADERWHYMMKVPGVDNVDLEYLTSTCGQQRILISGCNSLAFLASRMRDQPLLCADISRVRGPQFAIEKMVEQLPVKKIVFGSLWPVQIIEATLWQVTTAKIEPAARDAILYANAQGLLANDRHLV
jgi:predicted TIM-barrel fold metal-dependent hydrolase